MNKKEPQVYWANIQFKLKKSHENYTEFVGGDVYAFANCYDALEALNKFKKEIKANNLEVVGMEFVKPFENIGWEREGVDEYYNGLINEAENNDYVVLDKMYCDER